ncbi:hypothetical protein RB653_004298 [Dictyostelium firmibasis]|uniref:Lipoprotein n=1 Tax=Dictyostelium firmibasis TaxID=79012 RepID=A0AAN7U5X2_9MYCE
MKLFVCLIILAISLIACTKSTQIANEYINFVAYSDAECQQLAESGFGYSIASDTCVSIDATNNFIFTVNKGNISWSTYDVSNSLSGRCITQNAPNQTFPINSCVRSTIINYNSGTGSPQYPLFYKLEFSSAPYIPADSYINSFMGGECQVDNIVTLQYILNNTRLSNKISRSTNLFYCQPITNQPYQIICTNGVQGCQKPQPSASSNNPSNSDCVIIPPFYNSSSDSSYTSGCSGTGCCTSGSCSGTSGSFTGSSYTSGGYTSSGGWGLKTKDDKDKQLDITNNNNNNAEASYDPLNFYEYTFCS